MQNAIIFGAGRNWMKFKDYFLANFNVVAIMDNDLNKQGQKMDGFEILPPPEPTHTIQILNMMLS